LSFSDPSGLNDENVAYAPWNGPGMYANGGWGTAPYYGGGFGCTMDGFECGTTGIAGIGGLGGNGVAYCAQCGNPWQASGIGADNHVYEWLASGQPTDCSMTYCPATGYNWVDVGATVDESSMLGGRPAWESQVNGFTQITVDIAIVSVSFTQDHFHNRFLSLGLGVGAAPFSFSVANGWFNGKPNASSQTSCNTHSGLSLTAAAGLLFGGSESYTPSNGQWTTQMGVFSPQAGVGFSYGFPIQGSC